uniref:Uncharacterized protein n=1 Tax=Parastrongyloides trichosuri TaxID=131310 RepID=A0A0N5A3J1_PARTI
MNIFTMQCYLLFLLTFFYVNQHTVAFSYHYNTYPIDNSRDTNLDDKTYKDEFRDYENVQLPNNDVIQNGDKYSLKTLYDYAAMENFNPLKKRNQDYNSEEVLKFFGVGKRSNINGMESFYETKSFGLGKRSSKSNMKVFDNRKLSSDNNIKLVGLGKRSDKYNDLKIFGLGKRSDNFDNVRSFGLGKRSDNFDNVRSFGLGKRSNNFDNVRSFGLGKRSDDFNNLKLFGLGKRSDDFNNVKLFGLGKRSNNFDNVRSFGLGKRSDDYNNVKLFGLGKRSSMHNVKLVGLGKRAPMYNTKLLGLGKRSYQQKLKSFGIGKKSVPDSKTSSYYPFENDATNSFYKKKLESLLNAILEVNKYNANLIKNQNYFNNNYERQEKNKRQEHAKFFGVGKR